MCARITCPLSSSTENVVLGKTCLMLPNTSSGASLVFEGTLGLAGRGPFPRVLLRIAIGHTLFRSAKSLYRWSSALDEVIKKQENDLEDREGLSHKSSLRATGGLALLAIDGQVRGLLVLEEGAGIRGADLLELARLLREVEAVDDARGALVRRSQLPETPDIFDKF